MNLRQEPG